MLRRLFIGWRFSRDGVIDPDRGGLAKASPTMHKARRRFIRQSPPIAWKFAASGCEIPSVLLFDYHRRGARLSRLVAVKRDNLAASCGSSLGREAKRGLAALLLFAAAFLPTTGAAQPAPQPIFTELFAHDPAVPSQLLRKWRISSQLDSKVQPRRVGVIEDSSIGR